MSHVVTFVETPLFTRLVAGYLSDEAYGELQSHLANHPQAGAVIPGSGGVRKLRWARGHYLSAGSGVEFA